MTGSTTQADRAPHDHTWRTRSLHRVSEGTVRYLHCHCGCWQVRLSPDRVLATTNDDLDDDPRPGAASDGGSEPR